MEFQILKKFTSPIVALIVVLMVSSCEKNIAVDLPTTDPRLVIEGVIEQGQPPYLILTRTESYFSSTDINSLSNIFVHGADVTVDNGSMQFPLTELCSSAIPDSLLPLVAALIGVDVAVLEAINYCVYTTLDPIAVGEIGKTYSLTVNAEGKTATASTKIHEPVALDSVWFKLEDPSANDSLGFAWARLSDPDTLGNAYRWFAQRINSYADGEQKDQYAIAPLGSAFTDQFFNGLSFEFFYYRGQIPNSDKEDDNNEENGLFKVGDTIVVKFTTIGLAEEDFYTSFETEVSNTGNPFANPSNVLTNIEGGLGVWAGLGVARDTIIAN